MTCEEQVQRAREAMLANKRTVDEFVARPKTASSTDGQWGSLHDALAQSAVESATAARKAVEGVLERIDYLEGQCGTQSDRLQRLDEGLMDVAVRSNRTITNAERIRKLEAAHVPVWLALVAWAFGGASMILLSELWEAIR